MTLRYGHCDSPFGGVLSTSSLLVACRQELGGPVVPLPPFNESGDLPAGVHPVTLAEALAHFGQGSPQRQVVAARLANIHRLVAGAGHLARFVVSGRSSPPNPNRATWTSS